MPELPHRLEKDHIADSVAEIRFESTSYPDDAIFGLVYEALKPVFSQLEKLPILQIPEEIRSRDPNLRFKPYYKLSNDDFVALVGPRNLGVGARNYPGWTSFRGQLSTAFGNVFAKEIFGKLTRLGLRYINAFADIDIYEKIQVRLDIANEEKSSDQLYIRSLLNRQPYTITLQVANKADLSQHSVQGVGSILDIDTFVDLQQSVSSVDEILNHFDEMHDAAKRLFFSLLKREFLEGLGPQYNGD